MNPKQNKQLYWQLPFLALLIVGTVLIIRQQHATPYQKCAGGIFGTSYHIIYQYDDDLQAEIEAKMKEVDASLSMFNKESIISRINNNQSVELNDMFVEVFQQAEKISEDTDGAFDITVGPLVNAWGFGFKHEQLPNKHAVDSLMTIIGYKKVQLASNGSIKKSDPRITLDCSAIAKGYGVDVVARLLEEKGISTHTGVGKYGCRQNAVLHGIACFGIDGMGIFAFALIVEVTIVATGSHGLVCDVENGLQFTSL